MFNWLLEVYNTPVISDIISPDNTPDGYGAKSTMSNTQFFTGMLTGFLIAIGLWCLIKVCKYILKKTLFKNDEESDE